ncbi:Fe-S cluster assembly protein SufD [Pseudemcibacter aquimaris]|uniref:Fe-S cluster assembly protein SufD n=1 Tax=Pseudemcibacter aquimaris TaxID=2857064 RepID=UPI0020135B23|nr:Fe-S cluster assembly protein SufD [Pseudemcibacter aquimaris]MCC3861843.1 Fe-S cluster assembly protein SufD [Pseudemcibacter aquimaris]WDU58597.1 Fe-S cluster assembly protein SufD [Pseudemcibacter aquimaris]
MTQKNHFDVDQYADALSKHGFEGPNWLNDLRNKSLDAFLDVGLPGPKVEEWKYTNLSSIKSKSYAVSQVVAGNDALSAKIQEAHLKDIQGSKVVFVDGYFNDQYSDVSEEEGLSLLPLNDFLKAKPKEAEELLKVSDEDSSLANLNSALMTDGYVINVAQNIKLSKPIQIIHVATENSDAKALRNKNFISMSNGSSAQIIETFIGDNNADIWTQDINKITVAEKASLEIFQIQTQGNETIHMAESHVEVAEDADFKHYSLNVGAKLSRTEIKPTLTGLHGNVDLRGAFLGRDGVSHDVFTHMKHLVPECESDQIYRGVLDKGGKSAFQGKVYVAQDAQLTNAEQSNKNLLLDRDAEANSKPELLIYADDVKCAHGATVGELDKEALFYLNSRGMDQEAAKGLLVEAFIAEVYDDVSIDAVREKYLELARGWLG